MCQIGDTALVLAEINSGAPTHGGFQVSSHTYSCVRASGTNVGNCRLEHRVVAIIGKASVTLAIQCDVAAPPSVSSNSTELPRWAGPPAAPPVEGVIYMPRKRGRNVLPCIFHLHGRGYVGGSAAPT